MSTLKKPPAAAARLLVVDDALDTLEVLRRNLGMAGYTVMTAPGVAEALELLETMPFDLVITDLKMPRISGLDLVRHVRENLRDTEVMMITGYATIEGAVEAIKNGAEEYLAKPFTEEELLSAVSRVLDRLHQRRLNQPVRGAAAQHYDSFGIIGRSPAMQRVFQAITRASATHATVLITGESGTGKELVARAIHYQGKRAAGPFIAVNCGAIPDTLLESELFGHVKGSFTGASESRAGFFQTAEGGTIFLDEVSEIPLPMQVHLLRVLQDKEVCMVGSSRPRRVDVRIVAATNKDLLSLVQKEAFREDLYFRLNVLPIPLPPLREREEDILLLAEHFATRFARELDLPVPRFDEGVQKILLRHDWPGNVRELENLVQRLLVMSDGEEIEVPDLPPLMRFSARRGKTALRTLAEVEAEHIQAVLASVGGNRSKAALILGIDRKTLRERIKRME